MSHDLLYLSGLNTVSLRRPACASTGPIAFNVHEREGRRERISRRGCMRYDGYRLQWLGAFTRPGVEQMVAGALPSKWNP